MMKGFPLDYCFPTSFEVPSLVVYRLAWWQGTRRVMIANSVIMIQSKT